MACKFWLMKAEPDTRIVNGKDVKFSVDDFEAAGLTAWEGVRNHEAKNLMREMKIGDKVLFYHSNCKTPGIAGFAEVSKESYPDYTAWDLTHPYYDAKTDKKNPRWHMVNLIFKARAKHFVPLSLLKNVAAQPTSQPLSEIKYIGEVGAKAIKGMALVGRGRLSVQRVDAQAWAAVTMLADRGGWQEGVSKRVVGKPNERIRGKTEGEEEVPCTNVDVNAASKKRKATGNCAGQPLRRSSRLRRQSKE